MSDRGSLARTYLSGRGLSDDAVASFGLGYGPSGSDELVKRMEALGFERAKLLEAGLATAPDDAPVRDMFRGRLTFPIRNESGDLVGFGGRALDDAMPKYLNTPQSPVFDKSRLLYGLDKAREGISGDGRRVVVVEGYMDVIAAHEAGFRNVVASMGTALTPWQVELALARADTVVLALDADAAGQGAMFRNLLELAQRNANPAQGRSRRRALRQRSMVFDIFRVAQLPMGKDPDELIRNDPSLWRRAVDDAPSLADFLMDAAPAHLAGSGTGNVDESVAALAQVVFASHWTVQDRYVQRLASLVGTSPERLEANLGGISRAGRPTPAPSRRAAPTADTEAPFRRVEGDPLEEHVLALLVQFADLLPRAKGIIADRFQRPDNRAVLSGLQGDGTIDDARLRLGGSAADHLEALAERELPEMDIKQRTEALDGCIRRLEIRFFRELKLQEQELLGEAQGEETAQSPDLEANERLKELYAEEPYAHGMKAP